MTCLRADVLVLQVTQVTPFPDVELRKICNGDASCYDPAVLNLLDDFMVDAHSYGVKVHSPPSSVVFLTEILTLSTGRLIITMHSFNALQAGDVYGQEYGTGYFYEQTAPQEAFDKRLQYILNHQHRTLGKPWKLSDYIFGFEAENEAIIGMGEAYIGSHCVARFLIMLVDCV